MVVGIAAALAALLSACAAASAPPDGPTGDAGFPSSLVVDYQLGGGYAPAPGVGGVVRDSTDVAEPDAYSICYVNGFQSQPADRDLWMAQPELVLIGEDGQPIIDGNWPDELIFDISTDDRRRRIAALVGESIAACAKKGFAAVEIDNLDSYTRSGGRLTEDDAIALATLYARTAHDAGLLIGQKNAAEMGLRGRDEVGFDFAVAEECVAFEECSAYRDVYGEAVLDVEYTDNLEGGFDAACAVDDSPHSTILRDRDLTPAGDADHVFEACPA
ncbi:endo alpha-1,4 polygalactosaminidase [Microbacterium sp. 1P10UB]|uniref:endo alpha-1,4 polygalactosaminidase n=1 Tax=unclassified Microbacterium TaxID=2609290 RepID=UPI0039A25971